MTLLTKVGTVTKDTTTGVHTQTFASELGFTASGIIFWATAQTATGTAADANMFIGFTNGTTHVSNVSTSNDAAASSAVGEVTSTSCVSLCINGSNTSVGQATCTITANGFSLVWSTTTNNQAYKINYWAFGGTDITNVSVQSNLFAGTGNRTYTTTGSFQGDILLVMGTGLSANAANGGRAFGCFGAAVSSSKQFVSAYTADGSLVTMDTKKTQRTNKCVMAMNDVGTVLTDADFVAWTSTGFTLNHTVADTGDAMLCMIIKGGKWDVGNFTQKTSTGTQDVTIDSTINPDTVMLSSFNATATTSIIDHSNLSIGASDGTNERSSWEGDQDAALDSVAKSDHSETKVIRLLDEVSGGATLLAEADVSDLTSSGKFTLDWTTADATAREICFVVLGILASGTTFNRSPTAEDITVADASTTRLLTANRAPSADSTTVTAGTATRMTSAIRVPSSDSTTVSDASVTGVRSLPRVPSADTTVVADSSLVRLLSSVRNPGTDTTVISDSSLTRTTQAFRSPTADTITAVDSSTTQKISRARVPSADSTTVSDASLTRMLQSVRTPTADSITAVDGSVTRLLSALRLPSQDTTAISENITGLKSTAGVNYTRSPSADSTTVTDASLNRMLSALRLPSTDSTTTVDSSLTRLLSAVRTPTTDTVTAADSSTTQKITRTRVPGADTITVIDSTLQRLLSATRVPTTEVTSIADASLVRRLSALRVPTTDAIVTSENVSRTLTTAGQFNRSPTAENITVAEASLVRLLQAFRVPSPDSSTVVDASLTRIKTVPRTPTADTVTIADASLTRIRSLLRAPTTDVPGVVEASLTRMLSARRVPGADTVTVNELANKISHSRSIQDTLTVTEPVLQRVVTAIRSLGPEFVDVSEQVFFQTWHRFVFDSVTVAESLFSIRESLSGSVTYATPDEVRPLLGNLGSQRTDPQIQTAIDSAYDEINRKTNRIPPNDWKDTEADFGIIKKIARYKAALEMSIGIKDFEDREAMQKEVDEMFMIIESNDPGGVLSNDMVISSDDETYALNPSGLIWSTRYKNLRKSSSGSEGDTTINTDT
jgi:hypothetical protein